MVHEYAIDTPNNSLRVTQAIMSCVFSGRHKKGPHHRRKIYANSL